MTTSRLTRRRWLALTAGVAGTLVAGATAAARSATAAARSATAAPLATRGVAADSTRRAPVRGAAAQPGGMLRATTAFGAPALDPVNAITTYIIQYGMGEALIRITPQATLEPWLAESVQPLDALRWRVRLRPGIRFWNGRAMDADAVRSAALRVVEKRRATATLLDLALVEVVDSLTLDMVTRSANGAFLGNLGGANLIVHDADEAARVGDDAFASSPVLTGPMIPTDFRPREYVAARRNDDYWQGTPSLAGITFQIVSDANARLAAGLSGDVDLAHQIPVQGVVQARAGGLSVSSVDEQAMNMVYFNQTKPPFDDVAVRRAVSLAIDRRLLVESVMEGSGSVATGPYPSFFPFADPTPLPYDPSGAMAALDGAGWVPGSDGIRARGGQRLEFTLTTYPQRPELTLLATVIQSQLAQVGMSATLRPVEQVTPIVNSRDYDATMYRLGTAPTADPGFVLNTAYASWGTDTSQHGYSSPRLDAATLALNAASDPATRLQLALQAQAIMREEVPSAFLLSPKLHIALSSRVQNFTPHPFDFYLINHTISVG